MLFRQCCCLCLLLIFLLTTNVNLTNGKRFQRPEKPPTCHLKVIVGPRHFPTIQSAIDRVPTGNNRWFCIHVFGDKTYIVLEGEGIDKTLVVWDDHETVAQSPTLSVSADNFIAKDISFVNSYNYPWSKNSNRRAAAAAGMILGDKCSFYNCGFYGVQDTLWDAQGRHYFSSCTIAGAVDFIFGTGQTIYEGCTLLVTGDALNPGSSGFITAQGRTNPNDGNGFVFKSCTITGTGLAYLGRPWRGYAKALFYNTTMDDIIVPSGWSIWNSEDEKFKAQFAEYKCRGKGANQTQRVWWQQKLHWDVVQRMISYEFIDTKGWLTQQPFSINMMAIDEDDAIVLFP